MPEYLSPAVYVEEVDTGSKPIEGVSTSTAGMVGVTERGPVNVPILITSYGDFRRWFGGLLRKSEFSNTIGAHSYLPHAVEGFFTNGGKRTYVVRVLNTQQAEFGRTLLFDGDPPTFSTRLLRSAAAGDADLYLLDNGTPLNDEWLQIDAGSLVEYMQVAATSTTRTDVALRLPTVASHDAGTVVHSVTLPAASASVLLAAAADIGDTTITVTDGTGINPDVFLRIGNPANGEDEFAMVAAVVGVQITLHHPLRLAKPNAAVVEALTLPAPPADPPALASQAAAGSALLFVDDSSTLSTLDEFLYIDDGDNSELHQIGNLGAAQLGVPAYAGYGTDAIVNEVSMTDAAPARALTAEATAGSNVISLDNREGLVPGSLLRIGAAADPDVEYLRIDSLPNRQPSPDAGIVVLEAALQRGRAAGAVVQAQTVTSALQPPSALAVPANRNSNQLVLSRHNDFAAGNVVEVRLAGGVVYYHRIASTIAIAPVPLTLSNPLTLPHLAGVAVDIRSPLLRVRALDQGAWGNRLRIAIQNQEPPLLETRISEIVDSEHIRLASVNGVESGTVLQLVDSSGAATGAPFKVVAIDRQQNNLVELDATDNLPAAATVDQGVRSREFQMDVLLLRQLDDAVPTRNEQVLDSESFRNLSMDPRHSRYVEKVIGTTWDAGADADHAGQPLRKSDRRSQGESRYARVRDLAQDDPEPDRTNALEDVRPGPEPLLDTLPDGRQRPSRRPLNGGNDAVAGITDDTYIGQDDREPENRTGIFSFKNQEDISLVACPGITRSAVQGALIAHCELMRFRFAVLDGPPPPRDTLADVQAQRQNFDTKYAALYHPWLSIRDPYPLNLAEIPEFAVSPAGHVLGIYARTDTERGVHKAPANEVVRGIIGLQRQLNMREHDILNPSPVNINVIRDFRPNNRGIRVWGARVITSDTDWKYVNVRRLLIFIEHSIDRGLQWVVFEPNAEPLWARVRRTISNFLTVVWRNGALEGTTVEEAFFVKCDRTTMTQTDIDNGRLICEIGVAPVKPAEFVIIRIGLWTAHANNE